MAKESVGQKVRGIKIERSLGENLPKRVKSKKMLIGLRVPSSWSPNVLEDERSSSQER